MAMVSLAEVKDYLGISSTTEDTRLSAYLAGVEAFVKTYCKRDFESQSYVQYYHGTNLQAMTLQQTPVTTITGVWLNNSGYYGLGPAPAFGDDQLLVEGTDYVLDRDLNGSSSASGILYRIGTVWPILNRINTLNRLTPFQGPAWGNIKVSYTAGYDPVPADLKTAICQLVSWNRSIATFGSGLKSEKIGTYTYELMTGDQMPNQLFSVQGILANYREVGW